MNNKEIKELSEYFEGNLEKWDIQDRLFNCTKEQRFKLLTAKKINWEDWSISNYFAKQLKNDKSDNK